MSQDAPLPEPPPQSAEEVTSRRPALRQLILVGLLAVALFAMFIDRTARQRSNAAFDSVQDAFEQQMGDPDGGLTQPEVEQLIGRGPAEERSGQRYRQARYSWRAGLPWRTYDIWVVYRPQQDEFVYQAVFFNEQPTAELSVD